MKLVDDLLIISGHRVGHLYKPSIRGYTGHVLPQVRLIFTRKDRRIQYSFIRTIISGLHNGGTLGLFSGLNIVALVLVFLLVEETKRRNLEDLDLIFAVSKRRFMSFQIQVYLPWLFRRCFLGSKETEPQFYHDLIWDPERPDDKRPRIGGEPVGSLEEVNDVEAAGTRLEPTRRPEYVRLDERRVEHDGNVIGEIDGNSILEIDGTAREELEGRQC
jgi:hypothetical protein